MKLLHSLAALATVIAAANVSAMSKTPEPAPQPVEAPGKVVRFIALGDAGTGKDGQYKVADAIEAVCVERGCDFAIGLGDNIYESGVDSTDDQQWLDKFETPYRNVNFPFYMALGNHDNSHFGGEGLDNFKGEHQVDYTFKENKPSNKWQMPARYYRFTAPLNDQQPLVDFFALDSNPIASTISDFNHEYWQLPYRKKQADWVNTELQKTSAPWKIAFAHHPYMSNGRHGNAGLYDYVPGHGLPYRDFIKNNICDRFDVMIAGHDHDLQWLRPVQTCGKTFHMVSGAAGKTREFSNPDRNKAYWQADETLGFFYIEIEGDEFRGTAYTVDSETGAHTAAYQQTIVKQ